MEDEPKKKEIQKTSAELEQEIIDKILLKDELGALIQDLIFNTLLSKENKLSQGMSAKDFDIIFSTFEAINTEILHTLTICPNRYDPNSKFCQFPKKEEVKFTEEKYDKYNDQIKKYYKSFKIMLTPRIRKNLIFNIASFNFKMMINNEVKDYKMEHNSKDKDILCLISHKLKLKLKDPKKPHKYGKIIQILEQAKEKELAAFWDYYEMIYIIFCVPTESKMKEEYDKFPKKMKEIDKNFKNIKLLFYIEQNINKDRDQNSKLRNIFVYNNYGKNYFFLMNPENQIYLSDNMLFSGDIIENAIAMKKKNDILKKGDQETIKKEQLQAFIDLYNFYENLNKLKYALYFGCEFEICLKFNTEKNSFFISYIDFYKIAADLRPPEVFKVQELTRILKFEDMEDVREIEITDIPVDFKVNKCKICGKDIKEGEPMYYCYKCNTKDKYCSQCVMEHYNNKDNKGIQKFIDREHNLLFFKTRNLESFKTIDKFKLGNDIFNKERDENKFENYQRLCCGCKRKFMDSPRYVCLNCNKGSLIYGRFHEYCKTCIDHMMKGDEEGKKMQGPDTAERIYGYETRTLLTNNESYTHKNDEHVYIMIALEVKEKNEF